MMELAYYRFIEENSLEDTLYIRTIFQAAFEAGQRSVENKDGI